MNWIEDATEVLAEGTTPEGKRMQIVAEPVQYSGDFKPDGDGYVPTLFLSFHYGFSVAGELNGGYFPVAPEHLLYLAGGLYGNVDTHAKWERAIEVFLLGMGAKRARARVISLDRSSWGIMVSAFGQEWQDMTGVVDDYTITDSDTEDFKNWLKGEVSWVTAREATHDCNCEYCKVEWIEMGDVFGINVYASPWGVRDGINGKYAYAVDDMIAQSGMIRQEDAA